ncbi:hypothetical protein BSKO_03563 [Bryopsis sp. KO-2023]|nr:hypothetical protein BSKO_03563 [Bryopsis sp. KO-2023]
MEMLLASSLFQSPFLLDEGIEMGHFENCPPHHLIAPWREPAMKSSKPLLPMFVNSLDPPPMEFQSEASIASSILQMLGGHMESPCKNCLHESLSAGMATEMDALRLEKSFTETLPLATTHEGINKVGAGPKTNISVADKPVKKPETELPSRWTHPSGPRKNQEGTEDAIQGILAINELAYDRCAVQVTLLVSGFLIGPKGTSVRDIQRKTGTTIRSQTQRTNSSVRTIREFTIQGSRKAQRAAVDCMKAAVDRYKFLAEGACWGGRVSQIQVVNGVSFHYVPPPKEFVPYAASIAVDWGSATSMKNKDQPAAE